MKMESARLATVAFALASSAVSAQVPTPVIGSIEAPYPAVQGTVQIAGQQYGAGTVPYGPAGTPLVLSGSNLGASGIVSFVGYKNHNVDPGYTTQATVTLWTSSMIFLTVPQGAVSGLVTVTSEGKTSVGFPFLVTSVPSGTYSSSCPAGAPQSQLQIITSSLNDGMAGKSYNVDLNAQGGTPFQGANGPYYNWSLALNSNPLPTGLSLSSVGTISGTPAGPAGPVSVTIQASDNGNPKQTNSAIFSLTIDPANLTRETIYTYSAVYDNVGNVSSLSDTIYNGTIMGAWNFQYDSLNRLAIGNANTGPYNGQYACWNYDAFGNRLQQSIASAAFQAGSGGPNTCQWQSSGTVTNDSTPVFNSISNSDPGTNRVYSTNARGLSTILNYDASGNLQNDGVYQYLYDAESRVCAVSNSLSGTIVRTGYLYNAEGQRVAKGTITTWSCDPSTNGFATRETYLLGQSGEELTMLDQNNCWQRTNVFGGGKLFATYDTVPDQTSTPNACDQTTALHFHLEDALGTRRMQTDPSGIPEEEFQSLPFGDGFASYSDPSAPFTADDGTPLHYTGKERDTESGNDYFGARYYSSPMGRFMSPDWSVKFEPVPYANLENPQSLNLYSYVLNDPVRHTDVDGHECTVDGENHGTLWCIGHKLGLVQTQAEQFKEEVDSHGQYMAGEVNPGLTSTREASARMIGIPVWLGGGSDEKSPVEGANYAQRTFRQEFSRRGPFRYMTVEDVAAALKSGRMSPADVPIQYIIRDGNTLILNTRSAQALESAGIPRSNWSVFNMTGDAEAEMRLTMQLYRNNLDSEGTPTVIPEEQ